MSKTVELRRFRVHGGHHDRHHAVFVEEASFEAAVVTYVEKYPAEPDETAELRVIVHDVASGHEHCFKIDLDTGETSSCG